MQFTEPEYSKTEVRKAGKVVSSNSGGEHEIERARGIIASFRSVHAYPLLAVTNHVRNKAFEVSGDAIVAQRMKRLPTILHKLERHPQMQVTTMQDFGGCRVVFDDVAQVRALIEKLYGATRAQNRIIRAYDYLDGPPGPRESGYRGVHLVFEYQAKKEAYRGYRVELQVRTALQHSWATAVETMDLFTRTELKYGRGDADTRRYFAVVGSLMALDEGTSQVPGAEGGEAELKGELSDLEERLQIVDRLRRYVSVVERRGMGGKHAYFTLELNRKTQLLYVVVHPNQGEAEERLARLEDYNDEDLDVVLIGMKQLQQLEAAYPNYFADTSSFTNFVERSILI